MRYLWLRTSVRIVLRYMYIITDVGENCFTLFVHYGRRLELFYVNYIFLWTSVLIVLRYFYIIADWAVFYSRNPTSLHVTSLHIQVRAPLQPPPPFTHPFKSIVNVYFYSDTRVVCCSVISGATTSYFKGVVEISLRCVTLSLPAIMAYPAVPPGVDIC
jgi:hypothetical protein